MSYNPSEQYPGGDLRNPSGIVFFGKNPSKPMLDSSSTFLVDEDNSQLKVPNIVLAATGNIGIPANTGLIKLEPSAVTFATGVVIEGNLTVNGTTVTVNTETVTIDDNILVLNNNATGSATEDAGIEIERGSDNNVRIFWDEDNNYWSILDDDAVEYELATASGVQTFRNKTISGSLNTLTNIGNASLVNSTIGVTAGNGLIGGGSPALGSSTTLNVGAGSGIQVRADHVDIDIPSLNALTGASPVDSDNDYLLIYDYSSSDLKKVNRSTFVDGLGTMSSFVASGDIGLGHFIQNGDYLFISGGNGIDTSATGVDTITVTLNTEYVQDIVGGMLGGTNTRISISYQDVTGDIDFTVDSDLSNYDNTSSNFFDTAGSGLHSVNSTVSVSVDNSTIGITGDYLYVKNTGITSTQLASNAVTTAKILDDNVTYAKIQNVATANRVLGSTISGGIVSEVQVATAMVADDAITYVKMQNAASSGILLGNIGPVGNTITELSASQVRTLLNVADGSQPGTVTSVATAGSVNGITLTGGPITGAGTITLGGTLGNIANSQLATTGIINYGGVQLALGNSDLTPAFNLIDATGYKSRNIVTSILETTVSVSATGDQDVYLCNGGSGGLTVTLPTISSNNGRKITIKKIDSGPGQIIIDGNGSETIDGAASKRLYYENESMTLVCHIGATPGWYII